MENKTSHHLKVIRAQEQIIREMKRTNWFYFLVGLSLGIFLMSLTYIL